MDSVLTKIKKKPNAKIPINDVSKNDSKILISNKNDSRKKKRNKKGGAVIYIGHIPHGFYEDEMKSYFSQFGKVLATTVARSKKTGRSRGYGFVEFKDEEVAKIAAETMNNYLMYNRILKCRYIPPEEKRGRIMEKKVSTFDYPRQRNRKINEKQRAEGFSKLTQSAYLQKVQAKVDEFRKFFQERGIDFSYQIKSKRSDCINVKEEARSPSATCSESESKDSDNEFGVLEIDESENEISFKTPPQVKKIIKKSLGSPLTPSERSIDSKKIKGEKPTINKAQKRGKIEKNSKKTKRAASKKLTQKIKNQGKPLKSKESFVNELLAMSKVKNEKKALKVGLTTGTTQNKAKKGTKKPNSKGGNSVPRIRISVEADD